MTTRVHEVSWRGNGRWTVTVHADSTANHRMREPTYRHIAYMAIRRPIYWSDDRCKHWMFGFKADGWWVEATEIDMCEMRMTLRCEYVGTYGPNLPADLLEAMVGI